MSRTTDLDIKDILALSNGGADIFERELGPLSFTRNMSAPWRKDECPSLRLKRKNGIVRYKDFGGDQTSGSAIDFLVKLYGITVAEAIEQIKSGVSAKDYVKKKTEDENVVLEKTLIDFEDCPFTDAHKKYMYKYLLPENYLRQNNWFAVKKWALNKTVQKIPEDTIVFALYAEDIERTKILQIGKSVTRKWTNNVPNNYLWRFNKLVKNRPIWIEKSLKDALVMNYHFGFQTISLQNESSAIYLGTNIDETKETPNYKRVEKISKDIIVNLGTDPQGKAESIKITQARGYKWFNTPNDMYEQFGIEDPSDLIDDFGVKPLKDLLIKKSYL